MCSPTIGAPARPGAPLALLKDKTAIEAASGRDHQLLAPMLQGAFEVLEMVSHVALWDPHVSGEFERVQARPLKRLLDLLSKGDVSG